MNRDDLARHEADRSFIRRSVDDLDREREAGDLTDADYAELRAKYDRRLVVLDGQIDTGLGTLTPRKRRSPIVTVARIVAVAALAVLAGVAVSRTAGQRLPSDTVTGGNTRDANQLLVEARSALGTNRPAALLRFRQVLETQPDNAEARSYATWIERLDARAKVEAGALSAIEAKPTFERLDAEFDRAASAQPGYADPHCFQAVLRLRDLDDAVRAKLAYDACLGSNPNQLVASLVTKVGPDVDTALATNPDPVISGLAKARMTRDAQSIRDAIVLYDKVAAIDPANIEARTWSAWLLARGIVTAQQAKQISDDLAKDRLAKVEASLDAVLAEAPTAPDAACAKAVLALNRQDPAAAASWLALCRNGSGSADIKDAALRLAGT
jgi:tetratricopeptide (TPR) repeat protein